MNILNLTLIPTTNMSEEQWVAQRDEGVGGSDMSIILHQNPYTTAVELFYQKLGLSDPPNLDENESVFSGKRFEDVLLEDSCYYEPATPRAYIKNFKEGKKKNNHVKFPFVVINNRFPWIRCNLDGIGLPEAYDVSLLDGGLSKGESEQLIKAIEKIVEIKIISSRSADMWIDGIPRGYLSQVTTYCIPFLDTNENIYGEIYSKKDGTEFNYHRVEPSAEDIEKILTESREFWERVLKARDVLGNESDTDRAVHFLKEIQPEIYVDEEERVAKFYSDKYLKKIKEWDQRMKGDQGVLELALEYLELKAKRKSLDQDPEFIENKISKADRKLKEIMTENECTIIDLGENGKITWNRRLYVNLK